MTTTDLSKFGARERNTLVKLFQAWEQQGLPEGFYEDEVVPMMNTNSGCVFLTNSEYQVAMMNGSELEMFYSLSYSGQEGFADDLKEEYLHGYIDNEEDIQFLLDWNIISDDDLLNQEEEEEEEEE